MNGERRGGEAEAKTRYVVCGNLIVADDSEGDVSHFFSLPCRLDGSDPLVFPPPPVLNGITVAGRLERLDEGGAVMYDLPKSEMDVFSGVIDAISAAQIKAERDLPTSPQIY